MVVSQIINIVRTSELVYYMDEFNATVIYDVLGSKQEGRITFRIENTALGTKNISVTIIDEIDYPALPLKMELKKAVQKLVDEDLLPL